MTLATPGAESTATRTSPIPLSLATGVHERARPIVEGLVSSPDLDLKIWWSDDDGNRHDRFLDGEFDACEFSMAAYSAALEDGADLVAIPVFPNRRFRHSYIYVNSSAGVERPEDLKGKRIGVNSWANTAAVWVRGFLEHDYGVATTDVTWVRPARKDTDPRRPGIQVEYAPREAAMVDLLVHGEIAALITPSVIAPIRKKDPRVRRLFPNFVEVEQDYFRRTSIFPISHSIVVRKSVAERYPEVPKLLWRLFDESKQASIDYTKHPGHSNLVWYAAFQEEEQAFFGSYDPWSFRIEPNRPTIEAFFDHVVEQGLVSRRPTIETFFHKDTWSEP